MHPAKSYQWVSVAVCVVAVLIVLVPAFLAFSESAPMSYQGQPFPIDSPVERGTALHLTATRCNHTNGPVTYIFTRTLINQATGEIWAMPNGGSTVDSPGCTVVQSRVNVLPPDLPPGLYRLVAVTSIQGTYKLFLIPWQTEVFEVTE